MKKKMIAIMLAGVMALSITACGGSDEDSDAAAKQKTEANEKTEEEKAAEEKAKKAEEEKAALESYSEKPVSEFMAKAQELDYTVAYSDDGVDFTELINDMQADYSVDSVKVDTENRTVDVELIANSVLQARQAADALNEKLPSSACWIAAKNYGEAQYPYGFKLHYLMGKLAEEAYDENTWFLKAECTVTNAFGAEADGTCEIYVAGTKDAPQITSFSVY